MTDQDWPAYMGKAFLDGFHGVPVQAELPENRVRRLRVYIAGPMTVGDQLANIQLGQRVAKRLVLAGLAPFVPHMDAYIFFLPVADGAGYEDLLAWDFAFIEVCDAVLRLPGESPGADREEAFAQKKGIPVFHEEDTLLRWASEKRSVTC